MAFKGGLGALGLWTGLARTASLQALLMTCTVFKFDWAQESQRAKALVAAGEWVIEDEAAVRTPDPEVQSDEGGGPRVVAAGWCSGILAGGF
ncbi:MAG: hypothetical protein J3K34DRAFT_517826 [Monoraphidium minutum]|nr:MAG: hypothetical protein J3K34DRAFT_517826 [Monoraphidium minutum]